WGLLAIALYGHGRTRFLCAASFAESVLLAPSFVLLVFVSSQYAFSAHPRYALPVVPPVLIYVSQVTKITDGPCRSLSAIAMIASITSSIACYPHSLSYFNELSGGPKQGSAHLLGSSLEWGQDLRYLK